MSAELMPVRSPQHGIASGGATAANDPNEWLHAVLGKIYEAPGAHEPWRAVLELIKCQLDATHAIFMLQAPSTATCGVFVNAGLDDKAARLSYERQYFAVDPFVGLSDGDVVTADDLLGSRWLLSRIYRDYLQPLDIRHMMGADIRTADGAHCSLRLTRSHAGRGFDEADKALVRSLVPHVRRSIGLWSRIETLHCDREVYAGTVERLALGCIALAESGEVLHINAEARRILALGDGLMMRRGVLEIPAAAEQAELRRLIQEAHQPMRNASNRIAAKLAGGMAVSRSAGRPAIAVMVRPAPQALSIRLPRRPHVVLYLRDPLAEMAPPNEQLIRRVFGLTRAEARLAMRLTEGLSLDDAAEKLGMRLNTARTHLRSIFSKTGVSRQGLLVRLILRSLMALS
jgi:DNA-binding CsgD family transcriptional regulator